MPKRRKKRANYLKKNPFFYGLIVVAAIFLAFANQAEVQTNVSDVPPSWDQIVGKKDSGSGKVSSYNFDGRVMVEKVVDGDTIKVSNGREAETVRLIGIDTPETVHPNKQVECFGEEASARAAEILEGKDVILKADKTQGDRDKYGRLLRYVYLDNGDSFNELMIKWGLAHEYTYKDTYQQQCHFRAVQKEAVKMKRGFWGDEACVEELKANPNVHCDLIK